MYWNRNRLMEHLPRVYRERDARLAEEAGLEEGPLAALLGVIAEELSVVELNIGEAYDNQFVETCQPWVLAYIGELLGIEGLPVSAASAYTPRAYVANMLSYRRRKGTPGMLEQLARDTTGWYALVNEYFLLLAQNRHLNRSSGRPLVPDLRRLEPLERLASPFTETFRLPDIRNIDGPHQGRFNIPSVGLHLWPLRAFAPPDATGTPTDPPAPFAVEARPESLPANPGDPVARWYLHPLGLPVSLFNRPLSRDPGSAAEVTRLAVERDVPQPLRRLPLHEELEALRQAAVDGAPPPPPRYFGENRPVVQLFVDEEPLPVPDAEIRIVDFSRGWPQPDSTHTYFPSGGGPAVDLPIRLAFDPARGQVAFAPGREPARLRAVWAFGFPAELGSGPYDRQSEARAVDPGSLDWQIGVSRLRDPVAGVIVQSLQEAVDGWNALPPGSRGMIVLMDSMRYAESLAGSGRVRIPEGSHLTVIAADWPQQETDPGIFERLPGVYAPGNLWPHLMGELEVEGTAPQDSDNPGALHLEGVLLEGSLRVLPGHLGGLTLSHCGMALDGSHRLEVLAGPAGGNPELRVAGWKSILAPLEGLTDNTGWLLEHCSVGIPDDPSAPAVRTPGAPLEMTGCTVWGRVQCRRIEGSDCLFLGRIESTRRQTGCLRYSHVPLGSVVPRQFRCQPALAIEQAQAEGTPLEAQLAIRLRPQFSATAFPHPEFARLHRATVPEILEGGEDGREMGLFHHLEAPLRRRFLEGALDEFLRAGMQAGLILETTEPDIRYGQPAS